MDFKPKDTNRFLRGLLIFYSILQIGCGTSQEVFKKEELLKDLNANAAPNIEIIFQIRKGHINFLNQKMELDITPDYSKGSSLHTDMEMAYSKSNVSIFSFDPDFKILLLDIIFEEKAKNLSLSQIGCFTDFKNPDTYIKQKKWREPQKIEIAFNLSESKGQTLISFRSIQLVKTVIEQEKDADLFMHQKFMDKLLVEQLTEFFERQEINNALAKIIENFQPQL